MILLIRACRVTNYANRVLNLFRFSVEMFGGLDFIPTFVIN